MPIGWALLAGGIVLALASGAGSGWFFFGVGAGNLGFILLLFGYVVRAISFLPGRDDD
jgi:hypothetical protein